ncbi:hypothetical protein EVAR_80099_1 [Eumeta japonica]|uniref:Reverse transcriptase domain-containing protein n=1 Tax=Eumeta variegata TaxID=151549 RepID=A0A4C1UE66_EUMVA|nr:hypothetical protein EVAR_80099_1 [Eumeta japonica]
MITDAPSKTSDQSAMLKIEAYKDGRNKRITVIQTIIRPAQNRKYFVSLRIPLFWRDRPKLWFYSFEAATHDSKNGDQQMAQMRLLSETELSDQKPTQLLQRMQDLARDRILDAALQLMWTNHLPPHIHSVLAARSIGRFQSRHRTAQHRSRAHEKLSSMMCYYHRRFGAKVRKCTSTCSFKNASQQLKERWQRRNPTFKNIHTAYSSRMYPGLKNAGQTFQRYIDQVLIEVDFDFPFINDVLIASESEKRHREHSRTVLGRVEDHEVTINPAKCNLVELEVKFLGSKESVKPPAEKIKLHSLGLRIVQS